MNLHKLGVFLHEKAFGWAMILLYAWILILGVIFFIRYHRKTSGGQKDVQEGKNRFRSMVQELKEIQQLLMQSDDHVEDAQKRFDAVQKEAEGLIKKYGDDRSYEQHVKAVDMKLEHAYGRLGLEDMNQRLKEKFFKGKGNSRHSKSSKDSSKDEDMV